MTVTNQIYIGANGRESLIDYAEPIGKYKDIIVFIHGYKGFKDWGAWNLVQDYFLRCGIAFCKFNISHNGGTTVNPIDFPDLDAFSKNCYSYEVEDVKQVINWLATKVDLTEKRIHLMGHSRGGGIALLAAKDSRVSSVITLAAVSNFEKRFPDGEELEQWKNEGVRYVQNARTKQNMPHLYSFYEDWEKHKDNLNIEQACTRLEMPTIHFHGDKDEAVSILDAEEISTWTDGKLYVLHGANHTFDTYHPYDKTALPSKMSEICNLCNLFIGEIAKKANNSQPFQN